jgi:hypothetical protein
MDVDGEVKAQRKVSPLLSLYHCSFLPVVAVVVVVIKIYIKRGERIKKGKAICHFQTGRLLRVCVRPTFIRRRKTLLPDVIDVGLQENLKTKNLSRRLFRDLTDGPFTPPHPSRCGPIVQKPEVESRRGSLVLKQSP